MYGWMMMDVHPTNFGHPSHIENLYEGYVHPYEIGLMTIPWPLPLAHGFWVAHCSCGRAQIFPLHTATSGLLRSEVVPGR